MLRLVYSFYVSLLLFPVRDVITVPKPRARRLWILLNAEVWKHFWFPEWIPTTKVWCLVCAYVQKHLATKGNRIRPHDVISMQETRMRKSNYFPTYAASSCHNTNINTKPNLKNAAWWDLLLSLRKFIIVAFFAELLGLHRLLRLEKKRSRDTSKE